MFPSFQATVVVLLDFLVLGGVMTWVNGKVRVFEQCIAIPLCTIFINAAWLISLFG